MNTQTTFSAYWDIKNPKFRYGKHLKELNKKNVDFYFSDEDKRVKGSTFLQLEESQLPSLKHLKNLRNYTLSSERNVYLKFHREIRGKVFFRLASVWTSKLLLINKISFPHTSKFAAWLDCVITREKERILNSNEDGVVISRYPLLPHVNRRGGYFRDLLNDEQKKEIMSWGMLLSASCFKVNLKQAASIIKLYIKCLEEVDSFFPIYDEEIVLSYMRKKHPECFLVLDQTEYKNNKAA